MTSSLVEFSNNLADTVERAGASVIAVLEGGREGVSGTVWRDGLAVTAEHTIRGREEITIILPSGERSSAKVTGRDPGTDIALLKFEKHAVPATLADESLSRVGEVVLAVGRRGTEGLATTHGIVSAISGPWRTWQGARIDRWLRLDLTPFTGFSGGPIVTARGEVLGIATSGPRRSVVTIPCSTVARVADQLLHRGRIARGYLGVGVQPVALPESARQALGTEAAHGLLVITVEPGSSATNANILIGDIIVAIEGTPVRSVRSLHNALDPENVGKALTIELLRAGKLHKVSVTVGERPERSS